MTYDTFFEASDFEEDSQASRSSYIIDDPDLFDDDDDCGSIQMDIESSSPIRLVIDPCNDPKTMIKYSFNWMGVPLSCLAVYYYSCRLFDQVKCEFPTIKEDDIFLIRFALNVRYIGYLLYFLITFMVPSFIYECRNCEAPILISSILEVYYLLNKESEGQTVNSLVIPLLYPVVVPVLCFYRRKPYLRVLTNPWLKDKSELFRLIKESRRRVKMSKY